MTWLKATVAEDLLGAEVEAHVLRLRELLVRGDENLKAWKLLQCVPYWARDRPAIRQATVDQFEMVKHALEPEAYTEYYADNPHERPFEQQYGCTVSQAMDAIPRFRMLRDWLAGWSEGAKVIDLSGNDGAMAEGLHRAGRADVDVLDLNPSCIARAEQRMTGGRSIVADFRDDVPDFVEGEHDVAVLFETLEHLADPAAGLAKAAGYAPVLWVSTPIGAVEQLDLPSWAHVERKGHLHSFTPHDFKALLAGVTSREPELWICEDGTMVARVQTDLER